MVFKYLSIAIEPFTTSEEFGIGIFTNLNVILNVVFIQNPEVLNALQISITKSLCH